MIDQNAWSQDLEVGIGPHDEEVKWSPKAADDVSVGTGMDEGLHYRNRPEQSGARKVVLSVEPRRNRRRHARQTMSNLRDPLSRASVLAGVQGQGQQRLLRGLARVEAVRQEFFADDRAQEDVGVGTLKGRDGFVLEGHSSIGKDSAAIPTTLRRTSTHGREWHQICGLCPVNSTICSRRVKDTRCEGRVAYTQERDARLLPSRRAPNSAKTRQHACAPATSARTGPSARRLDAEIWRSGRFCSVECARLQ